MGRVFNEETQQLERVRPGMLYEWMDDFNPFDPNVQAQALAYVESQKGRIPPQVEKWLEMATSKDFAHQPHASSVGWRDLLTPRRVLQADGTQVLNTVTETIMCPDFTFAADYMEVGDAFKYTLLFDWSSVITTPGTFTFRLRWGGVAGTALCTSGAYAPDVTAAGTTISAMIEFWVTCRAVGATAASFFAMGKMTLQDFDDATVAALVGNLNMSMIPVSAPAAVGSLDTTTAKALSPTFNSSVATATTQCTTHMAFLESLN